MIRRALEALRARRHRRHMERLVATARTTGLVKELLGVEIPLQVRGWRCAVRMPSGAIAFLAQVHARRRDALRQVKGSIAVPDIEWRSLVSPDLLAAHLEANRVAILGELRDTILDPLGPFRARGHALAPSGLAFRIVFGAFPNLASAAAAVRSILAVQFNDGRCRVLLRDGALIPTELSMVSASAAGFHGACPPAPVRADGRAWTANLLRPTGYRFDLVDAEGNPIPFPSTP